MNIEFYNKLLSYAGGMLSKHKSNLFTAQDIVHDSWDFVSEDFNLIKKTIIKKYFYLKGEDLTIDIENINFAKKTITLTQESKQCNKCLEIKEIYYFRESRFWKSSNNTCKKCEWKKRAIKLNDSTISHSYLNGVKDKQLIDNKRKEIVSRRNLIDMLKFRVKKRKLIANHIKQRFYSRSLTRQYSETL